MKVVNYYKYRFKHSLLVNIQIITLIILLSLLSISMCDVVKKDIEKAIKKAENVINEANKLNDPKIIANIIDIETDIHDNIKDDKDTNIKNIVKDSSNVVSETIKNKIRSKIKLSSSHNDNKNNKGINYISNKQNKDKSSINEEVSNNNKLDIIDKEKNRLKNSNSLNILELKTNDTPYNSKNRNIKDILPNNNGINLLKQLLKPAHTLFNKSNYDFRILNNNKNLKSSNKSNRNINDKYLSTKKQMSDFNLTDLNNSKKNNTPTNNNLYFNNQNKAYITNNSSLNNMLKLSQSLKSFQIHNKRNTNRVINEYSHMFRQNLSKLISVSSLFSQTALIKIENLSSELNNLVATTISPSAKNEIFNNKFEKLLEIINTEFDSISKKIMEYEIASNIKIDMMRNEIMSSFSKYIGEDKNKNNVKSNNSSISSNNNSINLNKGSGLNTNKATKSNSTTNTTSNNTDTNNSSLDNDDVDSSPSTNKNVLSEEDE